MKWVIIFVLSILFLGVVSAGNLNVSDDVYSELENSETVRVVVNAESDFENKITEFGDSFTAEMSEEDLEELSYGSVEIDTPIKILLQDSVPLINASFTWPKQISSLNLTGKGQSVCILDSGIDNTNSDFMGRISEEYCYCSVSEGAESNCCAGGLTTDSHAVDNQGHGTHVAGIVGANGGIMGVAPEVNFVIIKVTNSSGDGVGSDLAQGIQRCVDNSETFNISVITISLGGSTKYDDYCDSLSTIVTNAINNAAAKNISVTIATGNSGWTDGISWPACVQNATPAGATNALGTSIVYNRGALVKLVAPGLSVNSTCISEDSSTGYCSKGGTSMATPHVAGAIIILNQFLNLSGQTKTVEEIENVLNETGKQIDDTANSGLFFSMIDILGAVLSLDEELPIVELVSPVNNFLSLDENYTFNCNATDLELKNVTLFVWNSTLDIVNQTSEDVSGSFSNSEINVSGLVNGNYEWNCLFGDYNGNSAFASENFSLEIGGVSVELLSPSLNNFSNVNETNFSCRLQSEENYELSNVTFSLWNSTDLVYNETQDVSGIDNTTEFNYSFSEEENYEWNCFVFNSGMNSSWADSNYSFVYDLSAPIVNSSSPVNGYSTTGTTEITFSYNASDNLNISKCDLVLNGGIVASNNSINQSEIQNISYSVSAGSYSWQINCTDVAGNVGNGTSRSFVINSAPVVSSSSGGGGGGSISTTKTYAISQSQIGGGVTKKLEAGDKINFDVAKDKNYKIGEHVLTVDKVEETFVKITVRSEPILFSLGINEGKKLNLSSAKYYDLLVRLEGIENGEANVTIKTINEKIKIEEDIPITIFATEGAEETDGMEKIAGQDTLMYIGLVLIGLFIGILISKYLINRKSEKSESSKK